MHYEFIGIPTHHLGKTGDTIMARNHRSSNLESRSARLRLAPRGKPYSGPRLGRGIRMDYRRNRTGNGSWIARGANGSGGYWTKVIAEADDYDESNGKIILNFYEAQDPIKKLGRGEDGSADTAPLTINSALSSYKADLTARGANGYNAEWPRVHLTGALLDKPVQLLTAAELKKWRDSLLTKLAPATINRLCGCLCAALELATQHDERILNRRAWEIGLALLPNAQKTNNIVLADDKVREFVGSAYGLDHQFGLLTDTLATTGARPSQAARLLVGDLRDHPVRPKLSMPKSGKGGGRNRSQKKTEKYSVPITLQLAVKLKTAAKGRAEDAPLLLQSDGTPWGNNPGQSYHREVDKVVTAIGCDPDATMYCLRHSSITRMLLLNVPIRLVSSLHDTSVRMIEKTYSISITEHSDDISRKVLLQHEPPTGDNVVALAS